MTTKPVPWSVMTTEKTYLDGTVDHIWVPAGMVLVHNHVTPARRLGTRGFRAWVQRPDVDMLIACDCKWVLWPHFRVRRAAD